MKTTKCQWINAFIVCALALPGPMRAQSSSPTDSISAAEGYATTYTTSAAVITEQKVQQFDSIKESTPTLANPSTQTISTTTAATEAAVEPIPNATTSQAALTTASGPSTSSSSDVTTSSVSTSPVASFKTDTIVVVVTPVEIPEDVKVMAPRTIEPAAASYYTVPAPVKADSLAVGALVQEQSIYDPDSIIYRIDVRMAQMDSLIHRPHGGFSSPEFLRWSATYTMDSLYLATLDKIAQTQASIIKAQSGIQLTGQTYYRPDAAFGIDEDTDDVSRYVAKIQAEVRWYFLQSGIYNRHGRIEEINLKTDLERLEHLKNRAEPQLYANRERLRVNSDSILASVMLHRITNLDMLEQAYLYLLDNENISSDNLLKVLDDRAEAERRLSTISTAPNYATSLAYVQAGTVTIDTMAIFETIYQTDLNLKILNQKSKLLDQQASNTRWLNDVRVAPFARYSHYFRHNMAVSANVDVGISFTVPINGEASRKRRELLLEKKLIDSKRDEVETSAADRVRYIVNEVYRLNRSISGEWRRAQSLKKYLKSRRQAYDSRQGEYNRLSALMEYNGYLRCLENIIEIQYRRDSLLADLQSLMPETPLDRYCAFIPLYTHE